MAAVVGTVRDSSGGLVPGAKVTLTSSETGISASKTTGDDGNYEFPAVRPGVLRRDRREDGVRARARR